MVGAVCGVVGVHVVVRRLPFATMALAHATFPGVVGAHLAGLPLLLGPWVTTVAVGAGLARLSAVPGVDPASASGIVLAGASAAGVLLQALGPATTTDLSTFLVGSVMTVTDGDLLMTAAGSTAVVAILVGLHKELVFGAFDRDAFTAAGYPVVRLELAVLAAIALTVVISVPAVGTTLSVALLVAPAAAARQWVSSVVAGMVLAAALGASSGVAGLVISLRWDIAGGPAIVLVATAVLALSIAVAPVRVRRPSPHRAEAASEGRRRVTQCSSQ